MFLIAALILFGAFGVNVALGAFANAAFLTGVGEMLLLLAAVVTFVVATLRSEAARKRGK
ncbi:conserved hypothetical protein [Roseovarius sp. EC-HK134]|jgi:hypothetical protein|uniref:DUF1328 domain-containing protein n=1 Tax=Roseovarius mucosus TaxID=215743 RepID=A0A1V0RPY3_9RHOB|nr:MULTISPECIES: hypothetical protein [Roseovarius]MBS4009775.1 hypothetical protein [Roseovarius sp.]ARE83834.1 hypothetical protein ROSMUCSMR3_02365 [Roseovarius mucosus]AWZ19529.1 Hypothetical protein RAK1035_0818 [Roseovarius sp. AK1035]EDM33704.1 hypothetical protein RTM1035_17007 [Roseovarius sp. TM1035]MBW4974857.1 hypothetical protein [Roseovarius mucosus]|tara:strand:- start:771 stop:950 length:180 start_codon:yes stop_codon:yes gene_type:complete